MSMKAHRFLLPLASVTALALGLSACGSTSSSVTSASGPISPKAGRSFISLSGSGPVSVGLGGVTVAGDSPVSIVILIDRTTLMHSDPVLANGYLQTALRMAEPTIARGGRLSVQVFGRVADHALNLYTVSIPSLSNAGPAARDDAGQTAALTKVLEIALGLRKAPTRTAAQALTDVTSVPGSDIAGAVRQGITDLATDSAPVRNVLVLTDGWIIEQGQHQLTSVLHAHGVRAATRMIVSDAQIPQSTRPVTMLRVAGLASTSGLIDPSAETVQQLAAAWSGACVHMPAKECSVSPQS